MSSLVLVRFGFKLDQVLEQDLVLFVPLHTCWSQQEGSRRYLGGDRVLLPQWQQEGPLVTTVSSAFRIHHVDESGQTTISVCLSFTFCSCRVLAGFFSGK